MSRLDIVACEQRSAEWYDARLGMVTASTVGRLLTPTLRVADNDVSRALTTLLVAERVAGWAEPTWVSADMLRGIEAEPIAREHYAEQHAPVRECGFMVRTFDDGVRVGYSPDGLVIGYDGIIEVKAPRAKGHVETILADTVPAQHMAQIQCGLLVSGREWCDYISWCGGLPMWVIRVKADPMWHKAIRAAVLVFEETAAAMVAAYRGRVEGLPTTTRVIEDLVI